MSNAPAPATSGGAARCCRLDGVLWSTRRARSAAESALLGASGSDRCDLLDPRACAWRLVEYLEDEDEGSMVDRDRRGRFVPQVRLAHRELTRTWVFPTLALALAAESAWRMGGAEAVDVLVHHHAPRTR